MYKIIIISKIFVNFMLNNNKFINTHVYINKNKLFCCIKEYSNILKDIKVFKIKYV